MRSKYSLHALSMGFALLAGCPNTFVTLGEDSNAAAGAAAASAGAAGATAGAAGSSDDGLAGTESLCAGATGANCYGAAGTGVGGANGCAAPGDPRFDPCCNVGPGDVIDRWTGCITHADGSLTCPPETGCRPLADGTIYCEGVVGGAAWECDNGAGCGANGADLGVGGGGGAIDPSTGCFVQPDGTLSCSGGAGGGTAGGTAPDPNGNCAGAPGDPAYATCVGGAGGEPAPEPVDAGTGTAGAGGSPTEEDAGVPAP